MKDLFAEHIAKLTSIYGEALALLRSKGSDIEAVLVHSGSEQFYHGDDRGVPFEAYGHFRHWLPVNRPDQFLYFAPGRKPIYYQIVPEDFWYDQSIEVEDWWADAFQIIRLRSVKELLKLLPDSTNTYLGGNTGLAQDLGIEREHINPQPLLAFLDFERACKTRYELEQLRAANRTAMSGHRAARECFLEGGNEYMIHTAFLAACNILEAESPYTNIVALDEKSAILHYQYKRRGHAESSRVLLIDAGCRVNGYGSDVTRTSVRQNVHTVFAGLLEGMNRLEQSLVAEVEPDRDYPDIHLSALKGIAGLLIEHQICFGGSDELLELEVPQLFMPHGVGHLLGIQVHDVGGHQRDINGTLEKPPAHSPMLRNTRTMAENMVFTIEPGCYFIPMLLEPERTTEKGRHINWSLVDELYTCGGIRVEDNVRVTADGHENLTRPFE